MPREIDPSELADRANGDVDPDLLTGTGTGGLFNVGYFADGPLLDHLESEDELHYLLSNLTKGLEIKRGAETEQVSPGNGYRTAALITDRRILFIVGQDDGDHVVEVPLSQATSARATSGILKNKIIVERPATAYHMYTRKGDDADAAAACIETASAETAETTTSGESGNEGGEETTTEEGQNAPADSDDESPLPAPESVAAIDRTAVQHVESARTLLADNAGNYNRAELVRAHTELCTALDRLKPSGGDTVEKIEHVVTVLESDLSGNASTPKTDGENPTSNDEQSPEPEKREPNPDEDTRNNSPGDEIRSVEVHVRDQEEFSINGADVTLDLDSTQVSGTTDTKGRCVLTTAEGTTQGEAKLSVRHPNFESTSGLVSVEPGRVYEIRLDQDENDEIDGSDTSDESIDSDGTASTDTETDEAAATETSDGPSREDLLAELQRLDRKFTKDVNKRTMYSVGEYHPDDYRAEFGSWDAAISVAQRDANEIDGNTPHQSKTAATGVSGSSGDRFEKALQEAGLSEKASDGNEKPDTEENETAVQPTDESRREELLEELRKLDENWLDVSRKLMYSVSDYHPDEYRDEFGSLDAALVEAGIDGSAKPDSKSTSSESTDEELEENPNETSVGGDTGDASVDSQREKLIKELRELDENWSEISRKLLYSVSNHHPSEFESEFGTLENALVQAGINRSVDSGEDVSTESSSTGSEVNESTDEMNADPGDSSTADDHREKMIDELRALDEKWSEIDRKLLYSVSKYRPEDYESEFGSLDAALVKARVPDIDSTEQGRRGELIAELQQLDEKWSDISRKLLYSVGDNHPDDYREEFGSLDAALVAAGIEDPDEAEGISEEDTDTSSESDSEDVTKRVKSRSSSRGRGTGPRFSKEDVLEEIRDLTEELGHTPSTVEFKEYGRMSPTPVYRYFSGWSEALEAAGVTGNSSTTEISGDDTESASRSTGQQASTPNTQEVDRTGGSSDLTSNELAELYEAFRRFQNFIEVLSEEAGPEHAEATNEWYQMVYNYWGGNGPAGAPNYGGQQRDRNEFSIREYRDAYGDGDSVTDYHHIELMDVEGRARLLLGDRLESGESVVPVAPDTGTALPFLVTEDELEDAKQLLSEFPAYPDADVPPPEDTDPETEIAPEIPEGRVKTLEITVLEHHPDPGSRRDARLRVQTADGVEMPLDIWSTHNITVDWTVGGTYILEQPRHKIWESGSGERHELSSTKDLQVSLSETGPSGTSGGTDGDGEDEDDEGGDIVDTIMDDIDLGGGS